VTRKTEKDRKIQTSQDLPSPSINPQTKGDMARMNDTLARKLHPGRFPGMSSKMAAIVGCILDRQFTDPSIAALVNTSDGYVLAQREGDIGYNDFIGTRLDLELNWERLLGVAGLTQDECQLAKRKYRRHISTV